jgi:hypothetical protein
MEKDIENMLGPPETAYEMLPAPESGRENDTE